MKNIFKQGLGILLSLFVLAACSPQEDSLYSLGTPDSMTGIDVTFTAVPTAKSANEIVFTNTTNVTFPVTIAWDLGNGTKGSGQKITTQYPQKGDYNVKLTLYAADGSSVSKTQVLKMANDDFGLVNTPVYLKLTGGMDKPEGKTWVLDRYNNFAKEAAAATGFNIKGHMGLGPQGSYGQEWWGAAPNDKAAWKMYDMKFNFKQAGAKLNITTLGEGYGRNASAASVGGFAVSSVSGDDALFPYDGGNYSFLINETGTYPTLKIDGNSFLGYYCGSQEYDIIYQTEEVMALRVNNTTEGQDWVFVYTLEELNVPPPAIVKDPKAVPLFEDFEGAAKVVFFKDAMGDKSGVSDNPLPLPINTSNKVYRYQKTTEFYSNISFTAATYKFDLTTQNKIKVMVFIPSYNDYTTDNNVAGSWIANTKLQPQLAVKLQNSEHPAPWETQTEIVKGDLAKDKWIELTFDFSGVSSRTDYDRIVIQFGAEGQSGPGFFFFDDFSFDK